MKRDTWLNEKKEHTVRTSDAPSQASQVVPRPARTSRQTPAWEERRSERLIRPQCPQTLKSSLAVPDRERLGYQGGVLGTRRVVQVPHRGLNVGMPHPFLHAPDVGLGDHSRPERAAEIVETQRPQSSPSQRGLVP